MTDFNLPERFALEPQGANTKLTVPWFVNADDLIGGWMIANIEKPSSQLDTRNGEYEIANFMIKEVAQHIVDLHNMSLQTRHVIQIRDYAWTLMHPLVCRPNLFTCPVTLACEALDPERPVGDVFGVKNGRYFIKTEKRKPMLTDPAPVTLE